MDKGTIKAVIIGAGATFLGTMLYNMYMSKQSTNA